MGAPFRRGMGLPLPPCRTGPAGVDAGRMAVAGTAARIQIPPATTEGWSRPSKVIKAHQVQGSGSPGQLPEAIKADPGGYRHIAALRSRATHVRSWDAVRHGYFHPPPMSTGSTIATAPRRKSKRNWVVLFQHPPNLACVFGLGLFLFAVFS